MKWHVLNSVKPTPGLVATGRALADLVEAGAMGVVHGAAGTGKTFAVETSLAGNAEVATMAGRGAAVSTLARART